MVTKGSKQEVGPTLDNHDQEFTDNCYIKLNEFSLMLMENVIPCCDKTFKKANNNIAPTEEVLKDAMEQERYVCIQNAIKTSAEATKQQFK